MEGTRKSLAFEADENIVRPAFTDVTRVDEDAAQPRPNRLQEIRRRMGGLGTREPTVAAAGPSGARVDHVPSSKSDFKPDRYKIGCWGSPVFASVSKAFIFLSSTTFDFKITCVVAPLRNSPPFDQCLLVLAGRSP